MSTPEPYDGLVIGSGEAAALFGTDHRTWTITNGGSRRRSRLLPVARDTE